MAISQLMTGLGRVADPDQSGQRIRIRIRIPDPDPGGQKLPTKVEKNL
jgi:hypothetical protein